MKGTTDYCGVDMVIRILLASVALIVISNFPQTPWIRTACLVAGIVGVVVGVVCAAIEWKAEPYPYDDDM